MADKKGDHPMGKWAERLQATLVTLNRKHLPMLERLHCPYDE